MQHGAAATVVQFFVASRTTSVPFSRDNFAHRDPAGMLKPPFRSMSDGPSPPLSVLHMSL